MQNAIDYAKQNPTSSYAQELQQRIQSGNYNDVLKQMGVDISKYGQSDPAVAHPVASETIPQKIEGVVKDTASNYMADVAPAAADITGGGNVGDATKAMTDLNDTDPAPLESPEGQQQANDAGKVVEDSTLGVASDAAKAVFAPFAAPFQTLIQHSQANTSSAPVAGEEGINSSQAVAARQSISDWAKAHPEIAKTLGDAINVGGAVVGGEGLNTSVQDAAVGAKGAIDIAGENVNKFVDSAKEAIVGTPDQQAANIAKNAAKNTNITIAALDPELKGAKLTAAYKEAITGNRTVSPSGIFSEQTLSPSQRTIGLGQRLSTDIPLTEGDSMPKIVLTKSPVKNTEILRQALTDTETKLTAALKGDPDINYNADKPVLYENLDAARQDAPNEFRIGENKSMTKNVFDFANKVAAQADDSIEGLRDARTAFDTQARTQYPNAFNPDGSVNVKTAAGNAVKTARDVFNEHLYNTAPKGSDIQKLIGREADIFQASNPVAAKTAINSGKSMSTRAIETLKKHPVISTVAAYEGAKHTVAPILPGI